MGQSDLFLLDTNVVIQLIRGNKIGERIDSTYSLRARPERPLISVVTVGEVLGLARQRNWGSDKTEQLEELLRQLVVVDINIGSVVRKYAELSVVARRAGRGIGDNDLWIASTVSVTKATLITTDKDFDLFHPGHLQRVWVDPRGPERDGAADSGQRR